MSDVSPELSARLQTLEGQYAENPAKFFMSLASALREAGSAGHAEEVLRENLKRHPGYLSAHVLLGRCLVDRGATEEATNEFHYVLSVDPQNLVALRFLAEIAQGEGRSAEAERWYGELLAIDPMNAEARRALAELARSGADAATADQPLPLGGDWPGAAEAPAGPASGGADPDEFGLMDLPSDVDAPAVHGVDAGSADSGAWGEISLDDDAPPREDRHEGDEARGGDPFDAVGFGSVDLDLDLEPAPGSSGGGDAAERPFTAGDDPFSVADAEGFGGDWLGGDPRQEPGEAAAADAAGVDAEDGFTLHDDEHAHPDAEMVTETMAELYAAQGMPERAAEVYRELIQQRGEAPALVERLAELEDRMRAERAGREGERSSDLAEGGGWGGDAPDAAGADAAGGDADDGGWLASVDAFASGAEDDAGPAEEPAPFPTLDFASPDSWTPEEDAPAEPEAPADDVQPAYAGTAGEGESGGAGGAFAASFAFGFAGSEAADGGLADEGGARGWHADAGESAPAADPAMVSDAAWPAFETVTGDDAADGADRAPAADSAAADSGEAAELTGSAEPTDSDAAGGWTDAPAHEARESPARAARGPGTIGEYFRALLSWQPGTAPASTGALPSGGADRADDVDGAAWAAPADSPGDPSAGAPAAQPMPDDAAGTGAAADEGAGWEETPWEGTSSTDAPEAATGDEEPPFDTVEIETEPVAAVPQEPVDLAGFTIDDPAGEGTEAASGEAPAADDDAEPLPWELPAEEQPGAPAADPAPAETAGFSFEDFFGGGEPAPAVPEADTAPDPQAAAPAPQPDADAAPPEQPATPGADAGAGAGEEDDEDLESFQAWLQSLKR